MTFSFGEFVLDTDTRQLRRDGTVVHLSPKAFDLLGLLVLERPRVLTKADLHARLWPAVYVSDASLAMLVAEVRAGLGETARESTCVRTVHRHGYAFQAEAVQLVEPAPERAANNGTHVGFWLVTPTGQRPLQQGENTIGRDPKSTVWIDEASVSRRHATVHIDGGRVIATDLASKNGTFVGDARVSAEAELRDGDELRIGAVRMTLRAWTSELTRTEGGGD